MKRMLVIVLACLADSVIGVAQQATPSVIKAPTGSVEMKDAAGDMGPISTSSGSALALDVVLLSIKSDGTRLTMSTTLNGPLSPFATSPVTLLIDVDNKETTGTKGFAGKPSGFEYKAELALCIKYTDKTEACHGGSTGGKPAERYAAINLQHFKGDSEFGGDTVVDSMGFPGSKASPKTPVTGQIVEASFDYADIKAKPGQVLRLLARETGGTPKDGDGAFPVVYLTLK